MIGWRNGEWVELPDGAEVSALHAGPSLFETFALRAGSIECLPDHLARLHLACPRLGLDPTRLVLGAAASPAAWSGPIRGLQARTGLTNAVLRLVVAARPDGLATEWLTARTLPVSPSALDLFILSTRRDAPEWLPRPKSGPWLNSSAAWRELRALADRPEAEGIQLDSAGHLSECTRSSLAWWDGSAWCFPAISTGRLNGTAAAQFRGVLALAGRAVREVAEPFPKEAQSIVVLRSTFLGGAILAATVADENRNVVWKAPADQAEPRAMLANLAAWRTQRCMSLL
jgi:branched-subunit amino acid aminotransferase/4-amino-4-deoxychorismate lyase